MYYLFWHTVYFNAFYGYFSTFDSEDFVFSEYVGLRKLEKETWSTQFFLKRF